MHSFYLVASPIGEAQAFSGTLVTDFGVFCWPIYTTPIMFAQVRILSLFLPLILLGSILAAQPGTYTQEAVKAFNAGTDLLLDGKARRAAKSFREAAKLDTGLIAAHRFLGIAEDLQGNYSAAAAAYQHVLEKDTSFSRLLYYQLGKVYYKMSRPKVALHYLERFQELQARDIGEFGRNGEEEAAQEQKILAQLDKEIRAAQITQDTMQFINVTKLHNLGRPVNTMQEELFPFLANNMLGMHYTRQGSGGDQDLLRAFRKDRKQDFSTDRMGNFNSIQYEGMVSFVRDGERIYFTKCTGPRDCDLFTGWLVNGRVREVEPLPDYVNSEHWESQPSISCDGQQLFFISNRPGGLGKSDIYRCIKNPDGTWGRPKNLGDGVNTPEHEEGPFLSNDGEALYFATSGHLSLGDQDIFVSYWDNSQKRFTSAINLGPPVNGPHREIGFHLSSNGRTGYVASDRPGGVGGLDIYRFELAERLNGRAITYVSGYVTDSLTGEPIANQAIPVGGMGKTYYTNYAGRFFICAPAKGILPLTVDHPDYLPFARDFAVPPWENLEPYRIDLMLVKEYQPPPASQLVAKSPEPEPEPVDSVARKAVIKKRPHDVLFNFDDASLLLHQIEGIDLFVKSLEGKTIKRIVVTGYTDEVGDEAYNIKLSQNRAKAVGIHLQTAGLKADEIKIMGLGELPGRNKPALNRKVVINVTYVELVKVD